MKKTCCLCPVVLQHTEKITKVVIYPSMNVEGFLQRHIPDKNILNMMNAVNYHDYFTVKII